jgi:Cdc6-like AAA superfamily ATPase
VAVNHLRHGRYCEKHDAESNSRALCAAVKDYIEPSLEAYRRVSLGGADGAIVYRTGNYRLVRKAFYSALNHGWAYCVDGAPGTRKTFLLRSLITELERAEICKNGQGRRAHYVRCRRGIRPLNLTQRIAMACGLPSRGQIDQLIRKVQFHFVTRRVLLVFDEAQHLDDDCIETVRELLDMPPFIGVLFAGSHDLKRIFDRLDLEQWRSRLQNRIELKNGVSRDEAQQILTSELGEQISNKELESLLRGFRVKDVRRGHPLNCACDECTYISARSLFFFIDQAKHGQQEGAE